MEIKNLLTLGFNYWILNILYLILIIQLLLMILSIDYCIKVTGKNLNF